jgi:hypothetical protein
MVRFVAPKKAGSLNFLFGDDLLATERRIEPLRV